MAGNHIYLRLDESETYLILAHLKQGSIKVKEGQHVNEGEFLAQVGNSGSSSEPHLHIHHQRQNPSKVSIFLSEGLPLYFRTEKGVIMPGKGEYIKDIRETLMWEKYYIETDRGTLSIFKREKETHFV